MPKYTFLCSDSECNHEFNVYISANEYNSEQSCPECKNKAKRVFTAVSVHHGRTIAQKTSGASLRTIEHGKFMKDAREKRKKAHDPNSREAQSNELWTGELPEGIKAPKKNKG